MSRTSLPSRQLSVWQPFQTSQAFPLRCGRELPATRADYTAGIENEFSGASEENLHLATMDDSTTLSMVLMTSEPTHRTSRTSSRPMLIGSDAASSCALGLEADDARKPAMTSGNNYVTPENWELKKATIQSLYLDKNMNLQDVISLMALQHDFRAT